MGIPAVLNGGRVAAVGQKLLVRERRQTQNSEGCLALARDQGSLKLERLFRDEGDSFVDGGGRTGIRLKEVFERCWCLLDGDRRPRAVR